jgi:hypothetical protein
VGASKNPLTGRGNAMVVAAPVIFGTCEALFHANPIVGAALGILAGAIAYRHFDDAAKVVDLVASGAVKGYSPDTRDGARERVSEREDTPSQSSPSDFRDIPIPIGTERNGKKFERSMRELKSVLILGLQEGGKSNTAVHLLRHLMKNGAHVAIIDKHARSEEDSLTAKMMCLEGRFDCPIGVDPAASMDVVAHVRSVLDNRIEGGKCAYPLFLVVDEFTAIMRQKEDGGKWQSCGEELASLVEDINTEGRKHQVFAICIGQIANVSRTGGGEIRELFATRIVHGMSQKQANLLSLTEINRQVEALKTGEVFIQTRGINETWLKIPKVEDSELKRLAATLPPIEKQADEEEPFWPPMEEVAITTQVLPETPELIQIGIDNTTKKPVMIEKRDFDSFVASEREGRHIGWRSIQGFLGCKESHARNIADAVGKVVSLPEETEI